MFLGVPTDKPHFETQEGDTEYITELGKVRTGHDAAHTLAYMQCWGEILS